MKKYTIEDLRTGMQEILEKEACFKGDADYEGKRLSELCG